MEFERVTKTDIEINTLKSKLEAMEMRVKFLEKNWMAWTKSTNDIGRRVVAALEEKMNIKDEQLSMNLRGM